MLNRRVIPYLIAVGLIALFAVSYLGYRTYQEHVEFEEFMSEAVAFRHILDKDSPHTDTVKVKLKDPLKTPPPQIESEKQSKTEERETPSQRELNKKLTKLGPSATREQIFEVMGWTEDTKVWSRDEMVKQFIELPDGKVAEILSVPGEEIREGDAISLEEIEYNRPVRIVNDMTTITIDEDTYDIPVGADREKYRQKVFWASALNISVEDIEKLIANREFFVPTEDQPLAPEELDISFKFLSKIPEFHEYVRAHRPDLLDAESTPDGAHQSSESWEISDESDSSSYLRQSPPSKSEPIQKGEVEKQAPLLFEPPTISSQETGSHEGVYLEHFDKAQQLIDQYGTEEGLRRLREVDPEAARQFERERLRSERLPPSESSPDAPDSKESAQ